jgi:hypothetical protein
LHKIAVIFYPPEGRKITIFFSKKIADLSA